MIISTMAKALVQCRVLTQAGWITLALAGVACVACWSLTLKLDMVVPCWGSTGIYARNRNFVTAMALSMRCTVTMVVTKKRAGLPRLASRRAPWYGAVGRADA